MRSPGVLTLTTRESFTFDPDASESIAGVYFSTTPLPKRTHYYVFQNIKVIFSIIKDIKEKIYLCLLGNDPGITPEQSLNLLLKEELPTLHLTTIHFRAGLFNKRKQQSAIRLMEEISIFAIN